MPTTATERLEDLLAQKQQAAMSPAERLSGLLKEKREGLGIPIAVPREKETLYGSFGQVSESFFNEPVNWMIPLDERYRLGKIIGLAEKPKEEKNRFANTAYFSVVFGEEPKKMSFLLDDIINETGFDPSKASPEERHLVADTFDTFAKYTVGEEAFYKGWPEITQAAKHYILTGEPYEGEIIDRLKNIVTRAFSPLAYIMPGVTRDNLIEELNEEAENFTGFGEAVTPVSGQMAELAIEVTAFSKAFGAIHKGFETTKGLPKVARILDAIEDMGGVKKFAAKFPRIFNASKRALQAFMEGEVIGQTWGGLEGIDSDMKPGEIIKHMNITGAQIGGVATTFSLVSSLDTALYTKKLRKILVANTRARYTAKINKIGGMSSPNAKAIILQEKLELQQIDNIVAAAEAQLMGLKEGKLFREGQEAVESPQKAADRIIKYGYKTSKTYPKGEVGLKKGLGKTKKTQLLPTTKTGEIVERVREVSKLVSHPAKAVKSATMPKRPPTYKIPKAPKAETPPTVGKAAPQPLTEGKTPATPPVSPTETAEGKPEIDITKGQTIQLADATSGEYKQWIVNQLEGATGKRRTKLNRWLKSYKSEHESIIYQEAEYNRPLDDRIIEEYKNKDWMKAYLERNPEYQPTPTAEAKQPWEMTAEQYKRTVESLQRVQERTRSEMGIYGVPTKAALEASKTLTRIAGGWPHEKQVQEALKQDKPVPLEVLQEYSGEKWAQEAMAKGEKAEKKTYTSVPKEWIKIDKLYDWGKKGLRGVRKYEPAIKVEGQRSRKTFIWRSEFADIPTRLPRETMAAFRAKTDEIFKVLNRKGEDYYLVPKQVVKEVREQLGEAAFERAPKPERTPLQRVNDLINSAKRHDLDDAEIGEAVLDSLPEMGLIEQQLSDKTKVYVKAYNDAKKSGELREDIQKGVEKEVQPTEEEAEERLAIQEEQTTSDIGDFLDGIIEEKAAPKAKSVTLPYANRKDFEQFFQYMSKAEEEALPPLVRQWKQRLVGAAGKEPIYSTGQSYRTTITPEMHTALENWAKGLLEDYSKDVGKEESAATLAAKGIIKWLNKVKFEKPRQKDLLGRAMLEGGAKGEQGEFLEKEKYKLAEPDLEGQQKIEFTEPAPKPKEGEVKEPQDREKIKVSNKLRPGFVDLTPLSKAGEQVRTIGEVGQKHITRFTGLESEVKQVLIEMEEQLRELPKVIAKESIDKFGKLTEEQERIIEDYREQPTKYDLPKELQSYYDKLEEGIEQYKNRLEELGYPADWPNTYLQRLEKQIAKEEAKDEPDIDKINNLKESLEEAKDLRYLHHYYIKDPIGKRIWGSFKRRISKKPRGVLGRKIPTYEKAEEYGLKRAPLAVSYAHMAHEIARAEQMDALIRAINENPNLSLPGDSAPDEWVYVDEKAFPASTTYSKWVDEEGKPRTKINRRKYPLPIAEALEEITYSRGNHPIERAYDKLNFGLKIIGFYNPLVMTKNDALQLWRAAGVKGALPLVMPQIDFQTLSIEPPKAIQIWMEKGAEYEKLRKGGLFNNIVSYTPAVTEITDLMLTHIRETSGEKTARIIGEWLNPKNLIKNLRKYNDASTWNMDEIMRIALWESVKDSPLLKEMTEFEKIEWCNDAMVNYGALPKETKRWLGKGLFVPTYRIGNFKYFWSEVNRVYHGQWQHIKPIVRTAAYKAFIKWGLPAIVAAAIYWKTGEERDARTEKGYRLVIHNPETNTDTVYALSDPLLEGAKITQRVLRHTLALNLAPVPSLVIRAMGGPKFKQTDDPFGEFFKLGTPLYRDIVNWRDKDKTITQKILTQLAIAFVYTRRGRTEDKESIISSLAKTLSIWTDWKEQQDDLRKMMTGKGFYTGPGGKFGRLIREFQYIQDMDRAEVDDEIDSFITKGDYEGAVRKMLETERYATKEGMSGRIMQHKAPLLYYIEVMGKKERAEFLQWLMDEKKYTEKELDDLAKALAKELE